ncbi:MAG: NAD-dependent malic enzyme [Planctomycetes bacterium]|nr:NAD-dependent malic enzyme [Planctomycetota bacterium]
MSKTRWLTLRHDPQRGRHVEVGLRGHAILGSPILNKGSAFSEEERDRFGLRGLLPPRVSTLEEQVVRIRENYDRHKDDLARYMELAAVMDRNETLYYRMLVDNIEELLPIVYTPTVGQACKEFGHILRRSRGIFLTLDDSSRMDEILDNWPTDDVRVIVVTDGERILGLGDLGSGGMGIPIGKLALYVGAGGIHPAKALPITLDTGTNNKDLIGDPLYMGVKKKRLRGADYDKFIEAFMVATHKRFPDALIQFEDFATANAFALLSRYQDRFLCFNDDIQGTACVVAAGVFAAMNRLSTEVVDQRFVMGGAGESVVGIAGLLTAAMREQGVPEKEAASKFWLVDSQGLVYHGRGELPPHKLRFARSEVEGTDFASRHGGIDLLRVVRAVRPTILMGASGQAGLFTREVIEALAAGTPRPILFALSNPTSKCECTAEQAFAWSKGTVIMATGSPFPPVTYCDSTYRIGQANNAFVFPGIGLGVIACKARRVTEGIFLASARALAALAPRDPREPLYPSQSEIRKVSRAVAIATVEEALRTDLCPPATAKAEELVDREMWEPGYLPYVAV